MSGLAFLLISDGRDEYRRQTLASAEEMLPKPDHLLVIDDADHALGFAGAIQAGWEKVKSCGAEWVFHCEADFTFRRPVPVARMIAVLKRHPELAQISLKRQPWNEAEISVGGIVELDPDAYRQCLDAGDIWTEHRVCFSTNPCVYPAALCHQGWPQVEKSEGVFTHRLLEDPDCRFALWGAKWDAPHVDHIGAERAGHGY